MKKFLILFVFVIALSGCSKTQKESTPHVENGESFDSVFTEVAPDKSALLDKDISVSENFIYFDEDFFLPILCLHHVGPAPSHLSKSARDWYISEKKFEEILLYLKENNYKTIFESEALDYIEEGRLPKNAVILSFDDGAIDFYNRAYPLLQKYNMKASMHIMTGVKGKNWMSKEQIKELSDSGLVEFGSHGKYHEYLTRVNDVTLEEELRHSKDFLQEVTGKNVDFIAYPFGLYDEGVIKKAKELGYRGAFTIKRTSNQKRSTPFELHRTIILEYTDIERIMNDEL